MKPSLLLASDITFSRDIQSGDTFESARARGITASIILRTYDPNDDRILRLEFTTAANQGPRLGKFVKTAPTDADRRLIGFLADEPAVTVDGEAVSW